MQIQRINPTMNTKQPQFKAVNQKYLEWAKRDIREVENISGEWLENIRFDTILFRELSKQDAIDTIEHVKKLIKEPNEFLEHVLEGIKNSIHAQ